MNQRIYQVCLLYIRRWPLWLVAFAYVAACGIPVYFAWFPNQVGRAINVFPDLPQPGPMVNLVPPMRLEQVSRDSRSIFWTASLLAPIETTISRPFPKLVSLQIVGEMKSADDLRVLRSMPNLEAISLLEDLSWEGLKHVGDLRRLHYLRILELPPSPDPQALAGLAQLQTLDVLRIPNYAHLFDEIRHLSNLHTLVLQGPIAATFKPSDWERLRSLPRLKHLYLRGNANAPDNTRLELERVQQILPNIKVRPATVTEHRSNIWCYIVFAGILIWGVLTTQLQSQFSHSGSCVIPNYAGCHVGVAAGLWVVSTTLHTVILLMGGCSFAASLSGCLAIPGLYWGLNAAMLRSSHKQNQAGTLNPFFSIATCFSAFPITALLSRYFLSDLDWFLEGHQPVLAWGITAASLVGPILVLRRIPRLHSIYQECLAGLPPLGISPKAWTAWGKNLADSQQNSWKAWWRGNQNARLDAALEAATPRDFPGLWIVAHMIDVSQIVVRMVVMTASYLVIFYILSWLRFVNVNWQPQFMPIAAILGGMWLEGLLMGLVLIWRSQRPMLGHELLRPASRKEFVQHLFTAIWRDMRPVLTIQLLAVAVLVWMLGANGLPRLFIPAIICYCVFRGLSNYAAMLLLMAIRRDWGVLAAFSLIWFLALGADSYLVHATSHADAWFPIETILLCLVGSGVSLLYLVWLKGYWQRIELA